MQPPFPYFGTKKYVASEIWNALGDVDVYVEPFAGSLAALLARPTQPRLEIVNDLDCYIANFWRAAKCAPDEVAHWANWPTNEADLHARHIWLAQRKESIAERVMGSPDYYDAKIAGWWVWGQCVWIGGHWCSGVGAWTSRDGLLVKNDGSEKGVDRRRPTISHAGITRLSLRAKRLDGIATGEEELRAYMRSIAERLRYVTVLCGDWERALTPAILDLGTAGVFLDPPYSPHLRDPDVYVTGSLDAGLNERVYRWCVEHQDKYRIVLAGYAGEYDLPGWKQVRWTGHRGHARADNKNRFLETLWLSPLCVADGHQMPLL